MLLLFHKAKAALIRLSLVLLVPTVLALLLLLEPISQKKKLLLQRDTEERRRDYFYQHQEAGKQEKNQMGLLTMDDGIVNWGEHTEDEETNHALMAISSSSEPNVNSVRPNVNTVRTNINSVRQNVISVWSNINTGRTNVISIRPRVSTVSSNVNTVRSRQPVPTKTSNSFSPKRPHVNQFNQRKYFSKSYSLVRRPIDRNTAKMSYFNAVKGNWGSVVKTSAGYNWRPTRPNSNCNGGPTFIRTVITKGSSTQEHGSKGYITGKGRIRVGNLDFDSVSFVKELGHFNLFSISQICDKQHNVLFTETECLVVSSDFKMPDEN
ncbi:hypothetical protein Tco_0144561 [Tanacetum coccineum]